MTYVVQKCSGGICRNDEREHRCKQRRDLGIYARGAYLFVVAAAAAAMCHSHTVKEQRRKRCRGVGKKGKDAPTHTDTHHAVDTMHAICKCARIILIPLGWKMCYSNLPSIFGSFAKVHQSAYRWCVQY